MAKLVRNFLHSSQQAASSSKPTEIFALNTKEIVQDEVQKMLSLYPGRVESALESDHQAFCFPDHLHQLIKNLIENALTHGPQNGKVVVSLNSTQLAVQDEGSGLPKNVSESLGTPFNRGRSSKGHGLGLAWCQTICELYDWKLTFETSPNSHTVFVKWNSDTLLHD